MASLREALMPRTSQAFREGRPWYSPKVGLASIMDQASLPGRAYVSLGRPEGEPYSDAVARTAPRTDLAGYQGEGDEFAEAILRDPGLPVGFASGAIRGLGSIGRALIDAGTGVATGAADQYAHGQRVTLGQLLGGAALGALPGIAMSRATPRASMISPEERAANFKNWFGDSKVVDEAGNPLVVYHGTPNNFDIFRHYEDYGHHFGDISAASERNKYTGGDNIKSVFIKSKKPLEINNDPGHWAIEDIRSSSPVIDELILKELERRGEWAIGPNITSNKNEWARYSDVDEYLDDAKMNGGVSKSEFYDLLHSAMKSEGYDAIKYPNAIEGGVSYAVRDPTKIKSSTGNRGTFDPNDPNITHFVGGAKASTISSSASRKAKSLATEAGLRKFLREDENRKAGVPVRTGLGGYLMSNPGDTFYTRGRP